MLLQSETADTQGMYPQDLCTSCGLCCDGTLFTSVALGPQEQRARDSLARFSASFTDRGESETFCQPCVALEIRKCRIYETRPEKCRSFRCDLLKDFQNGVVRLDDALDAVETAFRLRNERDASAESVGIEASGSCASDFLMRVDTLLESTSEAEKSKYGQLAVNSLALQLYISQHFLRKSNGD